MDFFEYRNLNEATAEKMGKHGRFTVYAIDPKDKSHLELVGVKSAREMKGRKTIHDYEVGDTYYELDPSNSLGPIHIAQTKNGLVMYCDDSSPQYMFIEKFKINNRNSEDLLAAWADGFGYNY